MYLAEFGLNWRSLLAASLGLSVGSAFINYMANLFGPPMLAEFGWSKADYALIGLMPIITAISIPVAGRFNDRFGPRVSAMIGFTALPLGFLAFTVMSGNLYEYFAIYLLQHLFGILTTTLVFAKIVVERFDTARGIALSIFMTGPPLAGAVVTPVMGELIQAEGWRAGYYVLAAISAAGGLATILLIGRDRRRAKAKDSEVRLTRHELLGLIRHPIFLLAVGGMCLVNMPQSFMSTQVKLMLLDIGVTDSAATGMLSLYAVGVILGRFVSGLALDRIPVHLVAVFMLGLPAIGLLILSSPMSIVWAIWTAIFLIGMAQGAEGDIGAFLISRRFDMKNCSLLLSFMTLSILIGSAIGSAILSYTLALTDSYKPFMAIAAGTTLIGALLFFTTGLRRDGLRVIDDSRSAGRHMAGEPKVQSR